MSVTSHDILVEQVCDELLGLTLGQFIAMCDERGLDDFTNHLTAIFSDVAEMVVEERSI